MRGKHALVRLHFKCVNRQTIALRGHFYFTLFTENLICGEYISRRLGHEDIETTMRTYAHLLKETIEGNDQLAIDTFTEMYQ